MEFALPDLLSREDIIKILEDTMNKLNNDELLMIYKTFVMPLSKRPERTKQIKQNHNEDTSKSDYEAWEEQVEPLDNCCSMDIDFISAETHNVEQIISNDRTTSPVGEKRRQRSSDDNTFDMCDSDDYQYQLSSVTKRIRTNLLS